jgi:hypothetical protein
MSKTPLFEGFPSGGLKVMYVSGPGENRRAETARRFRGLVRGHDVTIVGELCLLTASNSLLRADNEPDYETFLTTFDNFQPDLVIFDTVSALWGGKDEINNTEVRQWFTDRIVPLISAPRAATVILLAHTGKSQRIGNTRITPREQRGASEWGAIADACVYIGASSVKTEKASRANVEFARIGDQDSRALRFEIKGGGEEGPAIRFEASWADGKGTSGESNNTPLILATEAAVRLMAENGELFRPDLLERLRTQGHSKDAREGADSVLTGRAAWPSGPAAGQRVPYVTVDKNLKNPDTRRPANRYTWNPPRPAEPSSSTSGRAA